MLKTSIVYSEGPYLFQLYVMLQGKHESHKTLQSQNLLQTIRVYE